MPGHRIKAQTNTWEKTGPDQNLNRRDDIVELLLTLAIMAGLLPAICNFFYVIGFLPQTISTRRITWTGIALFLHCLVFFLFAIRWIAHECDSESDPWQGIRGTTRPGVLLLLSSAGFAAVNAWHFWFVESDPRICAG